MRIGVDHVVYAVETSDPVGGVPTYGPIKRLRGVSEMSLNPNASQAMAFLDDGPAAVAVTIGQPEISMMLGEVPIEDRSIMLGHTITGGVLSKGANDIPPWVAIGFRSLKEDGTYRYKWIPKCKFRETDQTFNTKGENVEFQFDSLTGGYVKRDSDGQYEFEADAGQAGFTPAQEAAWFDAVPGSNPDATAPTVVGSVPIHNATGVAVSASVVLTFDDDLDGATVIPSNFIFRKVSDLSAVAFGATLDVTGKIVTLDPTVNLEAATQYECVVTTNVTNTSGIHMAAPHTVRFTTA